MACCESILIECEHTPSQMSCVETATSFELTHDNGDGKIVKCEIPLHEPPPPSQFACATDPTTGITQFSHYDGVSVGVQCEAAAPPTGDPCDILAGDGWRRTNNGDLIGQSGITYGNHIFAIGGPGIQPALVGADEFNSVYSYTNTSSCSQLVEVRGQMMSEMLQERQPGSVALYDFELGNRLQTNANGVVRVADLDCVTFVDDFFRNNTSIWQRICSDLCGCVEIPAGGSLIARFESHLLNSYGQAQEWNSSVQGVYFKIINYTNG